MSQLIKLDSYGNQHDALKCIIDTLNKGGVIAYPTDSGYALGCKLGLKKPLDKIKKIRNIDTKHNFTLICKDLSEISHYAKVDNVAYRLLKRCTPGSFTFILEAKKIIPDLMLHKSKKTIGIRVSDHYVPLILSATLEQPLLNTTLIFPGESTSITYEDDIINKNNADLIDIIVVGDYCGYESTTVIDLSVTPYNIVRQGSGDILTAGL